MGMNNMKIAKPSTEAQKATRTTLDCRAISPADAKAWKLPPFQRGLTINSKVEALAGQIALDDGVIPGVFCIGILNGDHYLVDGQHRRAAFLMAADLVKEKGKAELVGYVDVRVVHFSSMAEMAEEFVNLNSRLVNMKADDIVRGLEESCAPVAALREACPFVGYGHIRRGDRSPIISMATVLRTWMGSAHESPHTTGVSAAQLAEEFSDEESKIAVRFFTCAWNAWGRHDQYAKLWSGMNLLLCAWLYRRIVLSAFSTKTQQIDDAQFTNCLMHLSTAEIYVQWLVGRGKRDMGVAYQKIKGLFATRLEHDTGKRHYLPQPPWASR